MVGELKRIDAEDLKKYYFNKKLHRKGLITDADKNLF